MLFPFLGLVPLAAALAWTAHPHHPRALKLQGAQGVVSVVYFTIEHQADQLAGLKPGFDWHAGQAELRTQVLLQCKGVAIPAGDYKLNARRGQAHDAWDAVLVPMQLARAKAGVRRAARSGPEAEAEAAAALEAVTADLKAKNVPVEIVLALEAFTAPKADHLHFSAVHLGYDAVEQGSDKPAGGMECAVRVSFGDLHRELRLAEVFAGAAGHAPTHK
jgi:hypothetical protein